MATQSTKPQPFPCWRPAVASRCALALGGLLLTAGPLRADQQAVHFVAPGGQAQPPVVLTAAVEPVEPTFVPPATRLAAPIGQPRSVKSSEPPIEFISPASRVVVPPVSLINPSQSAPVEAAPAPAAMPDVAAVVNQASPLATEIPGIPEFNFDDLLEAVSPTSIMQPAEEVAPPAVSEASPPFNGDSPMDPLEYNSREFRPITDLTIDAALPPGLAPGMPGARTKNEPMTPIPLVGDVRFYGGWPQSDFQWAATAFCHRPLYFEEINVERYGYTISPVLQPVISGAHFFGTIAALPYKMTRHCPCECIYTLGHYRPGDCVPRRWHHELWDTKAAAVELGVVTGLIFLIP